MNFLNVPSFEDLFLMYAKEESYNQAAQVFRITKTRNVKI